MNRFLQIMFALGLTCLLTGTARSQDNTDVIYMRGGRTLPQENSNQTMKVVEEKFDRVTVQVKTGKEDGGMVNQPSADILRIDHYDAPLELRQAISALESNQFQNTLDLLNRVKDRPRPYVDIYILFNKAQALRGLGSTSKEKAKEAAAAYRELLTKHPETIFKAQAMLGEAESIALSGDPETARKKFEDIRSRMTGTRWETMADLSLARIEERDGRYTKAIMIYRQVSAISSDKELKVEGKLGEIRCLVRDKRFDDALRKAESIISETEDKRVIGSAWSIIGDCYYVQAAGDKDAGGNTAEPEGVAVDEDALRKALLAYLRVVVVYFYDAEVTAKSAYMAGECFLSLGQKERAIEQYQRASETAGGGDWQAKAAAKLKG